MKNVLLALVIPLLLASCSDKEDPLPDVFSQVSEIKGTSQSQEITYDSYGRVVKYIESYPHEIITCTYSYSSDDLIKIHTEQVIQESDGNDRVDEYVDELFLNNGRADYCEGVFSSNRKSIYQKKYRHEFVYMPDNHLNIVKCTEWDWDKIALDWISDKPWSWENYYIWENGNLVEVEDYSGYKDKIAYTFKYSYSEVSGVQNIVRIHLCRYQYYPLQLQGIFGSMPNNLISRCQTKQFNKTIREAAYSYDIKDKKISSYTESQYRESQTGTSETFSVSWIH